MVATTLESRSFDVYTKSTISMLMIVILSYLKVNIEVLSTSIETMGSDDCRELLENNGNTNSMLAITWEKVRLFCKDRQKFINLFI